MILSNIAHAQSVRQALSQICRHPLFGDCHAYATGSDLRLIANHPIFQFEAWFFPSLFRLDIIKDSINYESRLFLS